MSWESRDRYKCGVVNVPGTNNYLLGSAIDSYQSFVMADDGIQVDIVAQDGGNWEISTSTYVYSTNTLTRETFVSSRTGNLIDFTSNVVITVTDLSKRALGFNISSPVSGQTLIYDSSTGFWINDFTTGAAIATCTDVTLSTLSSGQTLTYNGYYWTNTKLNLSQLAGVSISSPSSGQVLEYNGTNWINATSGSNPLTPISITSPVVNDTVIYDGTTWTNVLLDLSLLGDVTLSTLSNGQILGYNSSTGKWGNVTNASTPLTPISITSPVNKDVVIYNGTTWTNVLLDISLMSDMLITSPVVGQILEWNGSHWINATSTSNPLTPISISTQSTNQVVLWNGSGWINSFVPIGSLSGVSISSPTNGQVLEYNGTNWINSSIASNPLTPISITSPVLNNVVAYNGTTWVNEALPLGALASVSLSAPTNTNSLVFNGTSWVNHTLALSELNGTSIGSPTNGQVLFYNGSSWTNQSLAFNNLSGTLATTQLCALIGDVVSSTGSNSTTLAASGVTAGTYNGITVNAKGLVTSATNNSYLTANQPITVSGDVTGSGTTSLNLTLATVNSNVGNYGGSNTIPSITINAKGQITSATYVGLFVSNCGDVNVSGATHNQVLAFDGISYNRWVNTTLAASAFTDTTNASNITSGTLNSARLPALTFSLLTGSLPASQLPAFTGDVTSPAGSSVNTLATVNSNVGTFNGLTVNAKGLVTAATAITGDVSVSGSTATLAIQSSVNAGYYGSYTQIPNFFVNNKGIITTTGWAYLYLSKCQDTYITSPTDGQLLVYVIGNGWKNTTPYLGNGTTTSLLNDVSISSIANNQVLAFNSSTGKWTNTTLSASAFTDTTNASNITSGTLPAAQLPAFTGDITTSAGSSATTLATVNSNVGTFGNAIAIPSITVNAKGLITGITTNTVGSTDPRISSPAFSVAPTVGSTANSLAIGDGASVSGDYGTALGKSASSGASGVALGYNSIASTTSVAILGHTLNGSLNCISIGYGSSVGSGGSSNNAISIGSFNGVANSASSSVSIGYSGGIAFGANNATALGPSAYVSAPNATALGYNAHSTQYGETAFATNTTGATHCFLYGHLVGNYSGLGNTVILLDGSSAHIVLPANSITHYKATILVKSSGPYYSYADDYTLEGAVFQGASGTLNTWGSATVSHWANSSGWITAGIATNATTDGIDFWINQNVSGGSTTVTAFLKVELTTLAY